MSLQQSCIRVCSTLEPEYGFILFMFLFFLLTIERRRRRQRTNFDFSPEVRGCEPLAPLAPAPLSLRRAGSASPRSHHPPRRATVASKVNRRVPAKMAAYLTHQQKVLRLYKRALRHLESWCIFR